MTDLQTHSGQDIGSLRSLEVLVNAIEALAGAKDALTVADVFRGAARALTGADGICVILLKGARVHYLAEDAMGPLWTGQEFPVDQCISGWAIKHRETVVIEDVRVDLRIPLAAYEPTFVKSLVMAPVGKDSPIAAIGAYWAEVRRPSPDEVAKLEIMARAASVALKNVKLRMAMEEALDAAQSGEAVKSAFLANLSHEVRTPLNAVASMASLLASSGLNRRQRDMLDIIQRASDEAVETVSRVLEYSRIEAGGVRLVLEDVLLAEVVEATALKYAPIAHQKGLSFEVDYSSVAHWTYRADRARFAQIADALVSNAVKFTREGGVEIRLAEIGRLAGRSMLALTVQDTGEGVSAEDSARIFKRFVQADESSTRRHGGVGLGLSLAQALASAMGGIITLEPAAPGARGSAFRLCVPLDRATPLTPPPFPGDASDALGPPADGAGSSDAAAQDQPASFKMDAQPADDPVRRLRILCADDSAVNQMVLQLSLASLDADVVVVENGLKALESVAAFAPDVVVMDMQMPVLDGLEATRRIRKLEQEQSRVRTPVLMLTASAASSYRDQAFAAGADAFMTKPTTPGELVQAIKLAVGW